MKRGFVLQSLICLLAVSCSVHEFDTKDPLPAEDDVFYASLDPDSDTKVHVDEYVKTLWDAQDQISIFNKNTLNLKYEFMGNTGDNAGYFKRVSEGTGTQAEEGYVCAVYPYKESTSLDDSGVLTLTLPEKQAYREGSFGLKANTMVSTTDGKYNLLRFKNVGGYLVFMFYGDATVKSIKLEGRNGERLSGEATMTPVVDGVPVIEMAETAGTSITLDVQKLKLEKKEEDAIEFWMVVPPTVFTEGFLLTVTDKDDKIFTKETDQKLTIVSNRVQRIKPIEVKPEAPLDPQKVIYYTTSDKSVISPNDGAIFGEGLSIVSNKYVDLKGIMAFDGIVTEIGDHAFEECETLTGMTIPSTVTSIGEYAFAGCSNLGAPNTPSGSDITEPSKSPTRSGETTLVIPEGVTSIGAYAFKDCESLTSIVIPNSVTSIGDGAFDGCSNLTDVNIPDNVTEMGENVFNGCSSITTVSIPYGVESIDAYAFAECTNLTEIIIPDTVTSIGDYAFFTCTSLTSIDISSVRSIGKHAFDDCENLVGITIPAGVTIIEKGTFAACHAFTSIVIPEGVTSIEDEAFDSCSNLTDIELPSTLTSIGSSAFDFCSKLTGIVIPSQVTAILPNTFEGCTALTSIILPENIILIDDAAFKECSNLNFITVQAAVPPVVKANTFENTNDCPIYVPAESFGTYKTATEKGWSNYTSRIHIIGPADGMINGYSFVDFGDGLKWATRNAGDLLTWQEGKNAVEDWGASWRLPTPEEWQSLIDNCSWAWSDSEVGMTVVGANGNSIFLPAAGFFDPETGYGMNTDIGNYWSSSPDSYLSIEKENPPCTSDGGGYGVLMSVRPVSD